jgi:hypothetical protein
VGNEPARALIISFDSDSGDLRRAARRRTLASTAA